MPSSAGSIPHSGTFSLTQVSSEEGALDAPSPDHPFRRTPAQKLKSVLWLAVPVLALGLAALMLIPAALGYHRYVITGDSMSGSIDRGSIAFDDEVPVSELREGDVITYDPPQSSGVGAPSRTASRRSRKAPRAGNAKTMVVTAETTCLLAKVERGIQRQRSHRIGRNRRLRRGEHRDDRRRMRAVNNVRAASFYGFAAEIITNVEARNIRKYRNASRILSVTQIDCLPQLLPAEASQRQRAFAFDQAKDLLCPLTPLAFISEKSPHNTVVNSLRPGRANGLG